MVLDNEQNNNAILENSQPYKDGEAIGNMCVSQSLFQKQISLTTEVVKQSGLLNKNFTTLGE